LKVVPPLSSYAQALTAAMIEFYTESQKRFTPDMQSHYIYSPRELSRWVRALHEALQQWEGTLFAF
jgi:dynein heavy chain 1